MIKQTKIHLLKWQGEFLQSKAKEILVSGGYGSGKSSAIALKAITEAMKPDNPVLLVRKTLASLKRTTLKSLIERDGKEVPFLPQGAYTYNRQDSVIKLNGGGSITLMGFDSEMNVRSMNLGCVLVDEAVELSESEYSELKYRLRATTTDLRQIITFTNPGSPHHFLYKRFTEPHPDRKHFVIDSFQNSYLPEDYVNDLKQMTGVAYDRCVSGLWRDNEKMVWNTFMSDRHVLKRTESEMADWIVPIDFGFTNPTSILCLGRDNAGKIHVFDDFGKSRMLVSEILDRVNVWKGRNPICVVDPSAATLIAELRNAGYAVEPAYNPVEDGLELVRDMFAKAEITIEPGCSKLVSDIETYQRDDNDRVVKVNDHRPDALRYGCAYAKGKNRGSRIFVARVGEEDA